jgi:hypothetical protein
MMLYRVVSKNANGFLKWKVGYKDSLIQSFHPDTVAEAIHNYINRNGDDPLEFMVSLDNIRLITWETTGELDNGYPVAVIRSIESLGEVNHGEV